MGKTVEVVAREYLATQTDKHDILDGFDFSTLSLKQDGKLNQVSINKINTFIENYNKETVEVDVILHCNYGGKTGKQSLNKKIADELISIGWATLA